MSSLGFVNIYLRSWRRSWREDVPADFYAVILDALIWHFLFIFLWGGGGGRGGGGNFTRESIQFKKGEIAHAAPCENKKEEKEIKTTRLKQASSYNGEHVLP